MTKFEKWDSMYPSASFMLTPGDGFAWPHSAGYCSVYGYSFGENTIELPNKIINLEAGQFFSFFVKSKHPVFLLTDQLFIVIRLGYKCQNVVGDLEEVGRLTYIDGCSDSGLVGPARQGDPCLNHLHFPSHIDQSFHRHPTVRLGVITSGEGINEYMGLDGNLHTMALTPGTIFCLDEQQEHRFKTENRPMDIVIYHPDSEVGPTDHNHNMKNRTYLSGNK